MTDKSSTKPMAHEMDAKMQFVLCWQDTSSHMHLWFSFCLSEWCFMLRKFSNLAFVSLLTALWQDLVKIKSQWAEAKFIEPELTACSKWFTACKKGGCFYWEWGNTLISGRRGCSALNLKTPALQIHSCIASWNDRWITCWSKNSFTKNCKLGLSVR